MQNTVFIVVMQLIFRCLGKRKCNIYKALIFFSVQHLGVDVADSAYAYP